MRDGDKDRIRTRALNSLYAVMPILKPCNYGIIGITDFANLQLFIFDIPLKRESNFFKSKLFSPSKLV